MKAESAEKFLEDALEYAALFDAVVEDTTDEKTPSPDLGWAYDGKDFAEPLPPLVKHEYCKTPPVTEEELKALTGAREAAVSFENGVLVIEAEDEHKKKLDEYMATLGYQPV